MTRATAKSRPGVITIIAQGIQQRQFRIGFEPNRFAIELEGNGHGEGFS
jgi:hypothetical protein